MFAVWLLAQSAGDEADATALYGSAVLHTLPSQEADANWMDDPESNMDDRIQPAQIQSTGRSTKSPVGNNNEQP